jgi:hypothetical protein
MSGIARSAAPFMMGLDSLQPVTSIDVANAMRAKGFSYWGRYLQNLTADERDLLFAAGFAIWLISEARIANLSDTSGMSDGLLNARRALALGAPPKVHITIDSEATPEGTSAETVIEYNNANASGITTMGYDAMLYVGAGQPLDGHALYSLKADRYARGGSAGIPEPGCGFTLVQLYPLDQTIEGMRVDVSVIQADYRGRTPVLWYPS